ncbi:MAG TPA: 3-dehydroquinate synthase [Trueperaceae bacterium]|nr:3-dehydroquinate synthase [Trueperaceae bacterium]
MVERATPHLIRVRVTPAYTVTVGAGVLDAVGVTVRERRLALVSDATVAELYEAQVAHALRASGHEVSTHRVPAGEDSKSPDRWLALQRAFAQGGLDRSGAVVALGGGVVGDLAGFTAATYLRGVPWYLLATSLLAMVDASVGGKTAIDIPEGKNLVGAFWQPGAVVSDVRTLRTLPLRAFHQGGAELFKHGLLGDPALLAGFENGLAPDWPEQALAEIIARSVAVKAEIVTADEREAGARVHLNLGHTLAHALEAVTDHGLPHGEAVAYGLHYATILGRLRGLQDLTGRTAALLAWAQPAPLPDVPFEALVPYVARDKKARDGRPRFVLLEDIGRPVVVDDVTWAEQERAWKLLKEEVER